MQNDKPTTVPPHSLSWRWFLFKSFWKRIFGAMLSWLHVPGAIQSFEMKDAVSGRHIQVSISAFYTKLSIDGRDFYFHRYTGKFDGTGGTVVEHPNKDWKKAAP